MSAPVSSGRPRNAGFSLLEVVVAIGLCAGALGAVLAMLPPLLGAMTEAQHRAAALRVARAWEARWSTAPLHAMAAAVDSGEVWFADATGSRIGPATDGVWGGAGPSAAEQDGAKRYELVARRDSTRSGAAVLVYALAVRWPAYTGEGRRVTDPTVQSSLVLLGARTP